MKKVTTTILGVLALTAAAVGCNNGGDGIVPSHTGGKGQPGTGGGDNPTGGSSTGGSGDGTGGASDGTGGSIGNTGGKGDASGGSDTGGKAPSGGNGGTGGGGAATGGTGPATGGSGMTGGAGQSTGGAAGTGLRQGPFKMIVMSTALQFPHPSIADCLKMLKDLGSASAPERATIQGLAADATWTVDQIGSDPKAANYFSEVTADNLKKYELFYSNNPTGPVFTNAPSGAQKKQIFVDYWTNGGSWAGQHSATDFENNGQWSWFQDNIDGGWFVDHDDPTTSGSVKWQGDFANHPILKGLTSPWSCQDEWYKMNRDITAQKGFQVIAQVTVTNTKFPDQATRPAVWITENPKGGRSFYTIRGHNPSVYSEPEFRQLMLRGILWSVHRLPGGN
jgi:type 1 glutamine amidotransferase